MCPYGNRQKKKDNSYISPLIGRAIHGVSSQPNGGSVHKTIFVDILVIGSGPSALGFLINSLKTGRLGDLMRSCSPNV